MPTARVDAVPRRVLGGCVPEARWRTRTAASTAAVWVGSSAAAAARVALLLPSVSRRRDVSGRRALRLPPLATVVGESGVRRGVLKLATISRVAIVVRVHRRGHAGVVETHVRASCARLAERRPLVAHHGHRADATKKAKAHSSPSAGEHPPSASLRGPSRVGMSYAAKRARQRVAPSTTHLLRTRYQYKQAENLACCRTTENLESGL